ncbi:hypothetical protein EVA_18401 [gut metagenome]|uniref:Uncharacterized protein n=1 Tax=gut metagenome TaxID=749906 RepID=J9FGE5_9ZZZZ
MPSWTSLRRASASWRILRLRTVSISAEFMEQLVSPMAVSGITPYFSISGAMMGQSPPSCCGVSRRNVTRRSSRSESAHLMISS